MNTRAVLREIVQRHPQSLRWLAGILFGLVGLPGLFMLFPASPATVPHAGRLLTVAFPMGSLAGIWLLIASGAMPLWLEARAMLLPSFRRPFAQALLVLVLLTVALPAFVLGARWHVIPITFVLFLCAACAGALLAIMGMRAYRFAFWIWIACLIWKMALPSVSALAALQAKVSAIEIPTPGIAAWSGLFLMLAALFAWRVRVAQRAMGLQRPGFVRAMFDRIARKSASYEGQLRNAGPDRPAIAMRFLLGGPFLPRDFGAWMRRLIALVPSFVLLAWMVWDQRNDFRENARYLLDAAIALTIASGFDLSARLRQLRTKLQGDLSELALLPGWGSAGGARRMLLDILGRMLARRWVISMAGAFAFAWANRVGALTLWLAIACVTSTGLLRAAASLRGLAGLDDEGSVERIASIVFFAVFGATVLCVTVASLRSWEATLLVVWVMSGLAAVVAVQRALRTLWALPHPFLASRTPAKHGAKPRNRLELLFDVD